MITDKERLEELKGVVSTWITFLQEGEFPDVVDEEVEMIERLISTVEEQAEKIADYEMRYENTGAIFNRQAMQSRIEEQQKEIKHLKEDQISGLSETLEKEWRYNVKLLKENARLQKALEFYADKKTYTDKVNDEWGSTTAILVDRGKKARQALEGRNHESWHES